MQGPHEAAFHIIHARIHEHSAFAADGNFGKARELAVWVRVLSYMEPTSSRKTSTHPSPPHSVCCFRRPALPGATLADSLVAHAYQLLILGRARAEPQELEAERMARARRARRGRS